MTSLHHQLRRAAVVAALTALTLSAAAVWAEEPPANPPAVQPPPPPKGWESSVALGLTINKGNSDNLTFSAAAATKREWEKDAWALGADFTYGTEDGDTTTEKAHGIAEYKRLLSDRWYLSGLADIYHDAVADIEYRFTIGPNLGYYFIKSPATRLSGEVGPAFVLEKKDEVVDKTLVPPDPDRVASEQHGYFTVRLGEAFEHKFQNPARVWQTFEILPQVDDLENFRTAFEAGVEADIIKNLAVRLVFQHRYENQPAEDKKRNDYTLIGALAYKF